MTTDTSLELVALSNAALILEPHGGAGRLAGKCFHMHRNRKKFRSIETETQPLDVLIKLDYSVHPVNTSACLLGI